MSSRSNVRLRTRQKGQAALEFALVVVFLVVLLVSILEMTLFIYTYAALNNAAKEGVRYAVVHGSSSASPSAPGSTTNVVSTVQSYAAASLHTLSSSNVSVDYTGGNTPGSTVEVTVNYPYRPIFGMRWASLTISAHSAGRIMF
jgi:Flp pilus assembly protein TadG